MNRRSWLAMVSAGAAGVAAAPARMEAAVETGSGKSRLRSAICAYSFRTELQNKTMSYDDLIRLAVDLNVDGLDLTTYWFPNTTDQFLLPLRRLAYRSGVELYSISIRSNMCQPAAELQIREADALNAWVDVAAKLGAGHIRVFGGTAPKGSTEDEAAGWVASVLKRACEYAASKGVILGLENHGGITSQAARIVQIVKQVDSPWLGINLDTGNFDKDPYRQIEMLVPYAVNVQVKEKIRGNGGLEDSDWPRIVAMLRRGGYKGYLALEYEEKAPAPVAVPRLIRKLQKAIAQVS